MRIYVRVVERGSLSAAARDLGMGQPAVSERIAKLEENLGIRLLHRSTRSLSPTDVGTIYYERSKKVLEAADLAESIVTGKSDTLRGSLRIAAPHGIGEIVLPKILQRFRKRHPHLTVDLVLNDRVVDPIREGVDLSLRLGEAPKGACFAEPVGFIRRALVASPEYLAANGTPLRPQDLQAHPFMRVTGIFKDGTIPLAHKGKIQHYPINITWNLSNWRPLHALLLDGAGIGVLQIPAAAEALSSGTLTRLLPEYEVPGFRMRLIYANTSPMPEKTKLVVKFLKEELRFFELERDIV